MTKSEAFKKLVVAYGLKFKPGNVGWRTWHYVIFPPGDCNNSCLLHDQSYVARLYPDFNTNLFGDEHKGLHSLNEVIRSGLNGRLCSECTAKYISKLIDFNSLDELDIMLTLAGANR